MILLPPNDVDDINDLFTKKIADGLLEEVQEDKHIFDYVSNMFL